MRLALLATLAACLSPARPAFAQRIVPGPGEADFDAALSARADGYERLLTGFISLETGWGLEAFVADPTGRALVDAFVASGDRDFRASTGRHPYEVVDYYEEHGDQGMFGGVHAAGTAFRYAVLRDSGAPDAEVVAARDALLRAMDGLHWYTEVTGERGLVARGIRRITPEAGEPPLPGEIPATVPLADAAGNPLPADKSAVWRADRSGRLPFLVWMDDTSKDQVDGWVFALGAVYDVVIDDETIPRDRVLRLVDDALAFGERLMVRHEIRPGVTVDLALLDADGRLTSFHDLSSEEIAPGAVLPGARNGFNAWMGLGIVRTLFHITGDVALGRFYYEELLDVRAYLDDVEESLAVMYFDEQTNFSNVNMAFVAAYGLLRYESDPTIGLRLRGILHDHLYAVGRDREPRGAGQSFFDFLYAAFRIGERAPGRAAIAEGTQSLREVIGPPYWNPEVTNCDAAEIAALRCVAVDGSTEILLSPDEGRGGALVAVDPVPMHLRPPSNFEWRSDPHRVNGGGGARLNPAGDFHAAYWMGRYFVVPTTGFENVSPRARPAPPRGPRPDGGATGGDGGASGDSGTPARNAVDGGCGCTTHTRHATGLWAPLMIGIALLGRRTPGPRDRVLRSRR